jgi:hypothetical protein
VKLTYPVSEKMPGYWNKIGGIVSLFPDNGENPEMLLDEDQLYCVPVTFDVITIGALFVLLHTDWLSGVSVAVGLG